jgi:hypothetical protein
MTKLKSKHLNITNNGSSVMSSARSTERGCKQVVKGVHSSEGSYQMGKRRVSNKEEKHGSAQVVASVVGRIQSKKGSNSTMDEKYLQPHHSEVSTQVTMLMGPQMSYREQPSKQGQVVH